MRCVYPAELFPFMGENRRKEKRYIEMRGLRWLVPSGEWSECLKRGLITRVSWRVARLRQGVEIVWEDGKHLLRDRGRGVEATITSTWPKERDAVLHPLYIADPVLRRREILKSYGLERGSWKAA
jgi:hypothetical protein